MFSPAPKVVPMTGETTLVNRLKLDETSKRNSIKSGKQDDQTLQSNLVQ